MFRVRQMILLLYIGLCWLVFLATLLYALGFVANVVVPKSVDSGSNHQLVRSLAIDIALLSIIISQQVIMARLWSTPSLTLVFHPLERSTKILFHSLGMLLLFRHWSPISNVAWSIENGNARSAIWGVFICGSVCGIMTSLFLLARIRLPWSNSQFDYASQLRVMQWSIGLASLTVLLATPRMTAGHLLFSLGTLFSIFLAFHLTRRSMRPSPNLLYSKTAQPASQLLL